MDNFFYSIINAQRVSDLNSNVTNMLQGKVAGIQIRGYSSNYKAREYDPIDIEFEKIKIESTVTVKFEIE